METFSALLAICVGNSLVPVISPHKGQWRGAWMVSLICAWINCWVNNREAGDMRNHRAHYDVIVMCDRHDTGDDQRLTHWGPDKMADIFQTIFSNGFSWMNMYEFRLTFHWSLFLGVQLTIFQHWLRWWLGAGQATSHYLNQWWLVHWRIYVSLDLNELKKRWRQVTYPTQNAKNHSPISHEKRFAFADWWILESILHHGPICCQLLP